VRFALNVAQRSSLGNGWVTAAILKSALAAFLTGLRAIAGAELDHPLGAIRADHSCVPMQRPPGEKFVACAGS
jgi:hypothetical protein